MRDKMKEDVEMRLRTVVSNWGPANRIIFEAEEILIGSERLCIGFKEQVIDLDKIEELEFRIKGETFVFKRKFSEKDKQEEKK